MAQAMADSDLAIGAAGSTSWERCCLGLPTLMIVLAENQEQAAKFLVQAQVVILLHLGEGLSLRLAEQIECMVNTPHILQRMGEHAANITDGLGCERVLLHLTNALMHSN
jgi:spore coat polysaccharide biosynthesis predicted glycosyltransferase SpsG